MSGIQKLFPAYVQIFPTKIPAERVCNGRLGTITGVTWTGTPCIDKEPEVMAPWNEDVKVEIERRASDANQ